MKCIFGCCLFLLGLSATHAQRLDSTGLEIEMGGGSFAFAAGFHDINSVTWLQANYVFPSHLDDEANTATKQNFVVGLHFLSGEESYLFRRALPAEYFKIVGVTFGKRKQRWIYQFGCSAFLGERRTQFIGASVGGWLASADRYESEEVVAPSITCELGYDLVQRKRFSMKFKLCANLNHWRPVIFPTLNFGWHFAGLSAKLGGARSAIKG